MLIVSEQKRETKEERQARNFEFVRTAIYSHLDGAVEDRWAGWRFNNAVVFTDAARMRLGSIFGWITAMVYHDEPFAIKAADEICSQLDNLRNYGGSTRHISTMANNYEVSNYRIRLHCDGTLHGFGVCWYALAPNDYAGDVESELTRDDRARSRYRFAFNGGLLYHGPGGGEVFAVTLDSCLWSIHT